MVHTEDATSTHIVDLKTNRRFSSGSFRSSSVRAREGSSNIFCFASVGGRGWVRAVSADLLGHDGLGRRDTGVCLGRENTQMGRTSSASINYY